MASIRRCFNVDDLRSAARRRLPKGLFEFLDRGSEDELALAGNLAAFRRVRLLPRVLVDMSERSPATSLFGTPMAMPLAIAPTGLAGLCWHEGELALARAAAKAAVPIAVSTGSLTAIETIVREAGGRVWFQTNIWPDRRHSLELVERAERAGCEALILTVDNPVTPNREYNARNGFRIPFRLSPRAALDMLSHPAWLLGVIGRYVAAGGMPVHANHPAAFQTSILGEGRHGERSDTVAWPELALLRERWPRTLIVKGVLRPADAEEAVRRGADAVIVSNHGGRHLDAAPATLDMLPLVVAAVGRRVPVLMDGGVRRGSDVVKALALGARAVLVGRATLYGLAAAGKDGAAAALDFLRQEMVRTMAYLGCRSVEELDASVIAPAQGSDCLTAPTPADNN